MAKQPASDRAKLSAPARRALARAGYSTLEQLTEALRRYFARATNAPNAGGHGSRPPLAHVEQSPKLGSCFSLGLSRHGGGVDFGPSAFA